MQSTFNSSYTMKCQTSWLIKEKVLLFMHCKLLGGPLTEKKSQRLLKLHIYILVSFMNFQLKLFKLSTEKVRQKQIPKEQFQLKQTPNLYSQTKLTKLSITFHETRRHSNAANQKQFSTFPTYRLIFSTFQKPNAVCICQ